MKTALLLLVSLLSFSTLAHAQIKRPDTLSDTLDILVLAYRNAPKIEAVSVNRAEMSLALTLSDGTDLTSYPDNLHSLLQLADTDAERQNILDGFIHNIVTELASADAPVNPRNIFPVIRVEGYGDGIGDGPNPYSEPFISGLRVFFAEDLPTSIRLINEEQAQEIAKDEGGMLPMARENFLCHAIPFEIQGGGPYMLVADGNYESSFLLDTALWQQIELQLGALILIAPARDLVIFADGTDAESRDRLTRIMEAALENVAYPLAGTLMVWKSDHWEVD